MNEVKQLAKKFVDELVAEDGLDTGAIMHRKIEQRVVQILEEERGLKHVRTHLSGVASKLVDDLIGNDGLDTGAVMHRKIESRFETLLRNDQLAYKEPQ